MSYIPGGSAGPTFTTIYDVDFTSLPNQVLNVDGSVVIDGKTCYVLNTAKASTFAVQAGTGLYLRAAGVNFSNLNGPIIYWPIAENFTSLKLNWKELRIWFKYTVPVAFTANYDAFTLGVTLCRYTVLSDRRCASYANYNSGVGAPFVQALGLYLPSEYAYSPDNGAAGVGTANLYDCACATVDQGLIVKPYLGNSVGGNFPAFTAMNGLSGLPGTLYSIEGMVQTSAATGAPSDIAPYISIRTLNTNGIANVLVTRLLIEVSQ